MNQNFNDPRHPWSRLTAAARDVRDERDATPPYGFATRVVALAFAQERHVASLFERFAFRAVGVASMLALFSVALNYQAISPSPASTWTPVTVAAVTPPQIDESELVAVDDAVSIVLDFAD
jgi:hypothetical protein